MNFIKLLMESVLYSPDDYETIDSIAVAANKYEETIVNNIIASGHVGNILQPALNNANLPDCDILINDNIFNIEIKMNMSSQMASVTVRYDAETNTFSFKDETKLNIKDSEVIKSILLPKAQYINELLDFIHSKNPQIPRKLSVTVPADIWLEAVKKGMIKNIGAVVKDQSLDFLFTHYKNKNIPYIQIGGYGLYYMYDNPANLPIPQLSGKMNIEIRMIRAGSGGKLDDRGIKIASCQLRCSGRLSEIHNEKSPYTLDDVQSIKDLVATVEIPQTQEQPVQEPSQAPVEQPVIEPPKEPENV